MNGESSTSAAVVRPTAGGTDREKSIATRMAMLLDITQAATSSLELEQILKIAVEKVSQVLPTDRCSVVLVDSPNSTEAVVMATRERDDFRPITIDLSKYPEVRRSLQTREATYIEDALEDPLMADVMPAIAPLAVKSILVQPLISQDDLVGALFLRLSRRRGAFGPEEQEFARAAAAALANSVRNAKLHASVQKKRDDLELAYVERYRELTEANRRLRELARFKDELIAIISHDLRAPLQVVLGHGRMLEDARLAGDLRTSAEAVVRQARKILKMVESLLERGKGEQARVALDVQLLDVGQVARECAFELLILAGERQITLKAHAPEQLPVMGDELKLREVLQNLITNALEHAPQGGTVLVEGEVLNRPDGPAVKVRVQDDGPGMAEDQLHLVFDRYRHGPGGTGLGLAICKEFVELHGGEIWAERPADGGCAFVFTLPLAQEDRKAAQRNPPPEGEQPRVLVVEDEPDIAAVLEGILRKRYRVEVARDGREGVAKTHALHPDLVVMDVFLPHLDGLDAVMSLKASSDTADIPVILVSAQVGVADRVRALNLGAVDYLAKPFHASELLERTERALNLDRRSRPAGESEAKPAPTSDSETGLLDRRGLVARLTQEAARARRYGRPLALAVARTATEHPELLRTAAARMRERLRQPDVLAHLGHGTFAALLPECTSDQARTVFGRVESDLRASTSLQCEVDVTEVPGREVPEAVLDNLLERRAH
jgi:signal transduction histidine kinase/DNA-binding response OmpR family regulator